MRPQRWQQIKEIFHSALALPPDERDGFLAKACRGQDSLRKEIESLIRSYEETGSFIDSPAYKIAAPMLADVRKKLETGYSLGRYRIVSRIGAGGMGEVYLAEDTQLKRRVALKVLPPDLVDRREPLQRFEREARAASALNHPNIITVHEIGSCDETHFIAMEFVDGQTLRRKLQAGRLEIGEALEIATQIAASLDAAHRNGIVHRDIKPENVMVREDGLVKVLDFGLAKLTEKKADATADSQDPTRALVKTRPGVVMGTVAYMSPEQARGLPVDARTDVFSLGVVLYEMLSGSLPFAGETASDVIAAILKSEPAPFGEGVPAELQRILRKCLQKSADERYQTSKDLLIDLKSLKHDLDFSARLESSGSQAKGVASARTREQTVRTPSTEKSVVSSINQYRRSLTVALAVVLLAALGFGYWLYNHRWRTATQIESIAVLPFLNESGSPDAEYLSDGMTETLIKSLAQLPKLSVKARSTIFRYKGRDVEPQKVAAELSVQAVLNGRVVQRGDDLTLFLSLVDGRTGDQLWGEQYKRKMADLIALQSEIARDVSEKLRLRLTGAEQQRLTKRGTENVEAYKAYLKGRYLWDKPYAPGFEKSLDYFRQAIELDPTYALPYVGLADYYGYSSAVGFLPPEENWPKAEAAAKKAFELDDTLAEVYNPLAAVSFYYHRDWTTAERYFRRGLELNPNSPELHHHYANCLVLFGRNEETLNEIQRAVEIDPLSSRFNLTWARLLFFMRQYDQAIDRFQKTLELDQNYAPAHEWLGDTYEQKGMQREAISEWSKALILSGAGDQASSLERTYAASGFGAAVRALAQKRLEQANERMRRGGYVPAVEYVTAYMRLGNKEQAFAWLRKVAEERNRFALEFKVNPLYDPLRGDPRFQDLLRRVEPMP